jgi:hypothetical protein
MYEMELSVQGKSIILSSICGSVERTDKEEKMKRLRPRKSFKNEPSTPKSAKGDGARDRIPQSSMLSDSDHFILRTHLLLVPTRHVCSVSHSMSLMPGSMGRTSSVFLDSRWRIVAGRLRKR